MALIHRLLNSSQSSAESFEKTLAKKEREVRKLHEQMDKLLRQMLRLKGISKTYYETQKRTHKQTLVDLVETTKASKPKTEMIDTYLKDLERSVKRQKELNNKFEKLQQLIKCLAVTVDDLSVQDKDAYYNEGIALLKTAAENPSSDNMKAVNTFLTYLEKELIPPKKEKDMTAWELTQHYLASPRHFKPTAAYELFESSVPTQGKRALKSG